MRWPIVLAINCLRRDVNNGFDLKIVTNVLPRWNLCIKGGLLDKGKKAHEGLSASRTS